MHKMRLYVDQSNSNASLSGSTENPTALNGVSSKAERTDRVDMSPTLLQRCGIVDVLQGGYGLRDGGVSGSGGLAWSSFSTAKWYERTS